MYMRAHAGLWLDRNACMGQCPLTCAWFQKIEATGFRTIGILLDGRSLCRYSKVAVQGHHTEPHTAMQGSRRLRFGWSMNMHPLTEHWDLRGAQHSAQWLKYTERPLWVGWGRDYEWGSMGGRGGKLEAPPIIFCGGVLAGFDHPKAS